MLGDELIAPFAEVTQVLSYSEKEMIDNLGGIQTKLKLMNLLEIYTIILVVIFTVIGVTSLIVSAKYVSYFRREQADSNLRSTMMASVVTEERKSMFEDD